uniref:Reverse transcriptase n=2 Tax=Timema TaxID=61471 RepID=A0A7R9AY26_TIMSH|nr:unnamed protein product [Timema shepardi]CAD7571430.1 unnamed protein product [Timema californicum]
MTWNIEEKSSQVLKGKSVKLKMVLGKTTFMLFRGKLIRNPSIDIDGKVIRRIHMVRYVGVTVDENSNFTANMEEVVGRAQKNMNKIIRIDKRRSHLTMRLIKTYHQTILLSIVGYGACIWSHRLNNVVPARAIREIQRNILLRLSGAYRTVTTDAMIVTLRFIDSSECVCGPEGTQEHVVLECFQTQEVRRPFQLEIQGRLVGYVLRDPVIWKLLDAITSEVSDKAKNEYMTELNEARDRIPRPDRQELQNRTDDSDNDEGRRWKAIKR